MELVIIILLILIILAYFIGRASVYLIWLEEHMIVMEKWDKIWRKNEKMIYDKYGVECSLMVLDFVEEAGKVIASETDNILDILERKCDENEL